MASACEQHFITNHIDEKVRNTWKRASEFRTNNPWSTAQQLTHQGQPELAKKLISYYAKFTGPDILGLPSKATGICFFKVENGAATFETSCKTGVACPYPHFVPFYDY